MLITIELEVLNNEATYRELDRLLLILEDNKHEWYLKEAVEDIMELEWPKQLSQRHKNILNEILKKAFVMSANISNAERKQRLIFSIMTEGQNTLNNALLVLDDPLYIVVENETSDSLFLNRLYEVYPNPGGIIKKALGLGHLSYYPAGGRGETIKTLKNLAKKKVVPYKPRVFVFVDSDKRHNAERNSNSLQEIVDYCATEAIQLHITHKREIENYLPKEVLIKKIPADLTTILDEILALSPEQWDYFDLEKGFNDRRPEKNDPLFAEFADRANTRYNNLRYGLHRKKIFDAKKELFTFVNDSEFNVANIKSRCAHQQEKDELLNLLLRIKNTL